MYFVIHDNRNCCERLSQMLRESGYEVADIRPDDPEVPDQDLAGEYWTSAQVTMKICDMVPMFDHSSRFIISNPRDINLVVLQDLNIQYHLGATIYLFENNQFIDINSMIAYNITELEQTVEEEDA